MGQYLSLTSPLSSRLQYPPSSSRQLSHPHLLCYSSPELQQRPLLTVVPFLQPMLTEQENEDNKIPIKNKDPSALKTLACPCCSQLTMASRMTAG